MDVGDVDARFLELQYSRSLVFAGCAEVYWLTPNSTVSGNHPAALVAPRASQKESSRMITCDEPSVPTLSRRAFLGTLAAGPFVLRHRVADAAVDPAVVGWAARVPLPNIAIHLSAMPGTTRTFMAFAKGVKGTICWLYDWAAKAIIVLQCALRLRLDVQRRRARR